MKTLIDVEIKPKHSSFIEPAFKPIRCKLIEVDDDESLDYDKLKLKPVGIYTGQKTITEFFNDNLLHTNMEHILMLLQFVNEHLQDKCGNTMSNRCIIIGDKITSFGWRGFGYIRYLAKIFNTDGVVDYMEGYMDIDVESIIKAVDSKAENKIFKVKLVGRYTVEFESESESDSIGIMSIYTQRPDNYEIIMCNEFEIGIDKNNTIVNIDVYTDKQTFDNITERDIDKIINKCKAIVNVYTSE